MLVGALLELKARELFPDEEVDLDDLDPEEAAEELARRLEEFRQDQGGGRLAARAAGARARPLLPARPGPARAQVRAADRAAAAGGARGRVARARNAAAGRLARAHGPALPAGRPVPRALPRAPSPPAPLRVRAGGGRARPRIEQAVAFLALLELRKAGEIRIEQAGPFAPIRISRSEEGNATTAEEGDSSWNVRSA